MQRNSNKAGSHLAPRTGQSQPWSPKQVLVIAPEFGYAFAASELSAYHVLPRVFEMW